MLRNCSGPRPLTGESRVPQTHGEAGDPTPGPRDSGTSEQVPQEGEGRRACGEGLCCPERGKGGQAQQEGMGHRGGGTAGRGRPVGTEEGGGRGAVPPWEGGGPAACGEGTRCEAGRQGKTPGRGTAALRLRVKRVQPSSLTPV